VCGAFVALYADKLAHKRRQVVLSEYFEHVLQLPLSFHSATHSGRLMKVMLTGTDTLWWLWLGFFREHLAAIVSIAVLLPLSLYLDWRLGLLLIGLSLIFLVLTGFVLHKTQTLQKSVERYYSDLAERASDTLGNVALVQSFTRVEDEVRDLRQVVASMSWWRRAASSPNWPERNSSRLRHSRWVSPPPGRGRELFPHCPRRQHLDPRRNIRVTPAKAGVQFLFRASRASWIPACAGMTRDRAHHLSSAL
jgi:ABC-type multidrug transport system fused ATPase/permease subunit